MSSNAATVPNTSREAESRFRNIANCAPMMIIYTGVDGGSSFVNKAWLDFTGRSLDDELGDGFADTFHPAYMERVQQAYWNAFQERRPLTIELPMRRHDGEYRWMQACGTPRFPDNGNCIGYIGCFTDLTDQCVAHPELPKDATSA